MPLLQADTVLHSTSRIPIRSLLTNELLYNLWGVGASPSPNFCLRVIPESAALIFGRPTYPICTVPTPDTRAHAHMYEMLVYSLK